MDEIFTNLCSTPISENCIKLGSLSLSDINTNSTMKPKTKANPSKQTPKRFFKSKNKNIKLLKLNKKHTDSNSSWETDSEEFIFGGTNNEEIPKEQNCQKLEEYSHTSDEFPSPECIRDAHTVVHDLNLSLCISPQVYRTVFEKYDESDRKLLPTENIPLLSIEDPIESQSLEGSIVIDHEKLTHCKTYPPPLKKMKVPSKGLHHKACTSQKMDCKKDNLRNDFQNRRQKKDIENKHFSPKFSMHKANQLWENFMKGQQRVPESQYAVNLFESSASNALTADTFSGIRVSKHIRTLKRSIKNRNLGKNHLQKCKNEYRKRAKSPSEDMTCIFKSLTSISNLNNKPARNQLENFKISDSDSDG